ncbi:MAG: YqgE/AlgH family protein [Pirellulaceae bacterium]
MRWREHRWHESVIFVLQHNAEGVFGVIVNRPASEQTKNSWRQAIGDVENTPNATTVLQHLHEGGIKGGPVIVLHGSNSFSEMEVEPGVFMSATTEAISKIVNSGDDRYRIYCGIMAWKAEQIAKELAAGYWYLVDVPGSFILGEQEVVWEEAVMKYGQNVLCDMLGVQRIQGNPHWN